MKYIFILFVLSWRAFSFSSHSRGFFTSKWSFVTDEVLSLKKNNPLYFRESSADEQLSLAQWTQRLQDIEAGAQIDISRKDYYKKKLIVGKIIASVGDMRVNREEGRVSGDVKFLYQGDVIETKSSGSCWLVFLDGTMFRMSPETSFSISEVMFNSKSFNAFIRINKGELISINRTGSDSFLDKGRFLDLSFLSMFEPDLVEGVLSYFGETLFSNKKIDFQNIVKFLRLYTNDFRFENWKLKSNYSFYNENMLIKVNKSLSHFYVDDSASYLKVGTMHKDDEPEAFFIPVDYSGEESELKADSWYKFSSGMPSTNDYMEDKEYPIKMLINNITPFYLLRENFMNNYSYYISNVHSFPTIKNFSNFKGEKLEERVRFVTEYLKKSETTFRKVKRTYISEFKKELSSVEFRKKFHRTGLRLVTLRGLNVLNPNKTFQENRLLYSGLMEYKEKSQRVIKKLLKEAIINEENSEYLSRK